VAIKTRKPQNIQVNQNTSGSGGGKYAPVPEGFYLARVEGGVIGDFTATYKGAPGKYPYKKLTPDVVLLNEAHTTINRQDLVIGAFDSEGYLYRPDGDDSKPALFAEMSFFLGAVGFVDEDNNVDLDNFDPELLVGQIVKVKIVNRPYESRDGETRQKNVIEGWYALRDEDIDENDFIVHGRFVFANEADAERYDATLVRLQEEAEYGGGDFTDEL
jgi:hypothetical protein